MYSVQLRGGSGWREMIVYASQHYPAALATCKRSVWTLKTDARVVKLVPEGTPEVLVSMLYSRDRDPELRDDDGPDPDPDLISEVPWTHSGF